MLKISIFFLLCSSFILCEELPVIEFSSKNFPQVSEWKQYLGDVSYASYDSDSQADISIYNTDPILAEELMIPLYNDGRGEGFLGNFASFCSVNNVRLLEMLLVKGYHLNVYASSDKKHTETYTLIGYERDHERFIARLDDNTEKHIPYNTVNTIQFIDVKAQNNIRHWYITSIDTTTGKAVYVSEVRADGISNALAEVITRNFENQDLKNIKFFAQVINKEEFPIHVAGWEGETMFDQMINFSGSGYNTLGERVVTIYISNQGATGCHITRYTIGAKGDGYSDNIVSGEVYCQSTNPVAINKSAGSAQFLLRCKVRKNSPTPWWTKAQIYFRLFTPNK